MKQPKILALQALRLYACIIVLIYHMKIAWLGPQGYVLCSCALALFFILSGFVQAYNRWHHAPSPGPFSSVRFMLNRLKFSYPLHVLMMVAIVLLYLFQQAQGTMPEGALSVKLVLTHLTLTQSWIPPYFSLNGAAWFLADMAFFYLLTPGLLWLLRKLKNPLVLLALALAACVLQPYMSGLFMRLLPGIETYSFPPSNLLLYVAGLCMGGAWNGLLQWPRFMQAKTGRACVAAVITVGYALCAHAFDGTLLAQIGSWRYTLCGLLIFALVQGCGPVHAVLSLKPLVWLGGLSMEIYLTHLIGIWYVDAALDYLNRRGFWLYPLREWGSIAVTAVLALAAHWLLPRGYRWAQKKVSAPVSSRQDAA